VTVQITNRARGDLRNLDRQAATAIVQALNHYAQTGEGDVKALHGPLAGTLRLRIGPWRARFDRPAPDTIRVLRIEKRGDAYRD